MYKEGKVKLMSSVGLVVIAVGLTTFGAATGILNVELLSNAATSIWKHRKPDRQTNSTINRELGQGLGCV